MKLIDKAAVVAEIQRRKELVSDPILSGNDLMIGERNAYFNLLSFLDTLEVKKVNLDDDYIEEVYSHIDSIKDTADRMTSGNFMHHKAAIKFSANTIANVLELIGLKAEKGE